MQKPSFSIIIVLLSLFFISFHSSKNEEESGIRINLLGYTPRSPKIAIWCSTSSDFVSSFKVYDASNGRMVLSRTAGTNFGRYGPFATTYRLNFSELEKPGRYFLEADGIRSPEFTIAHDVYKGAADFCLRYMRQQRSGFNPYLKDFCHTYDGYTMYGPMPDSTHIDVSGGWHDASDYLQYATTSANATYHLLAAYRDFPLAFADLYQQNGLEGKNGNADVLDEALWGLKWLLKMHPSKDIMFNQLADDRDHAGMRMPKLDSFYGKGFERPVYFCTGKPQGLGRYRNRSTGVASTAGKFSSAFSLGSRIFDRRDKALADLLHNRAVSAFEIGEKQPGVCQTAPNRAPYFYEEDNWVDDMELAAVELSRLTKDKILLSRAITYGSQEPVTPWLGADTAKHYQWYPFVNVGHYELLKEFPRRSETGKQFAGYYKRGIDRVWQKANENAFFRGIPFIWCSNNLTTSFAMQCYWYRTETGDDQYYQLEQANIDWLFGCNPWGTSFVFGLPGEGDTPEDPHSAFTKIGKFPIDGGLVDGPVYGSIFSKLIGITLYSKDEYAAFQSDLVVYHDDYGDYATNEPTMDGTASLIYLLASRSSGK